MVNKKYLLLAGLCSVLALQPALAQESQTTTSASWGSRDMTYRGDNYDVLDSTYYTGKKLRQYRDYMNHQNFFPPKPNNMWEIGVNVGFLNVWGDVTSKTPMTAKKFSHALGFGLTVRKALGYFLSLRGQWMHGTASGFEYRGHSPVERPWSQLGYTGYIYQNYKTKIDEISLQLVGSLNNISFHKPRNRFELHGFIGGGLMIYDPKINAMNGDSLYDFTNVPGYGTGVTWADRKPVNDYIKNLLDDSYESSPGKDSHKGSDKNLIPVFNTGIGMQFLLTDRVSLQLEDKVTFTFRDLVDGSQLQNGGSITPDKDIVNYLSIGLGFNIGSKKKNVLPLWWVNPLDHAYSELSNPRHMMLPEPILPDSDGDGVADQFDKCPGTPAGVAVDTHGCPLDTDGDGVPDYKDKQLITPTECQPVDADGVGKCPCPEGCGGAVASACANIGAGSLNFSGNASRITPGMQSQLSNLAAQMSANPTCKVVIIGAGNASKMQQQRSWDRVNAVIEYMSEKHGIDRNRFIFQYGQAGDENTVMYRSANAGEEGPANVAPPFPNLRK
jgi:OmpA-OmpF porin, OOP family